MKCTPSNSLAVPVAASHMNNWINKGLEIRPMVEQLKQYHHPASAFSQDAAEERDIPVVMIYGDDEGYVSRVSRLFMDDMYKKYKVQVSCISTCKEPYDIRVRKLSFIEEDLAVMLKYYKTDLVLIVSGRDFFMKNQEKVKEDADIELKKDTGTFTVFCEKQNVEYQIQDLTQTIYHLLT